MSGKLARKVALAAAVVLCVGFLAGCVPPGVVLHGTITDSTTGDPVPGALVQVWSDTSEALVAETVADSTGTYRFYSNVVVDGTYRVRFGDDHWYDGAASWAAATAVTTTNGFATRIDVAIEPELGILSGTVTNGVEPLLGVIVSAYSTLTGAAVASTSTDATGTYSFDPLAEGEYWVRAVVEGFAPRYLGGTTTRTGATEVSVAEGATTSAGELVLLPAARLDARLLDAAVDGEPVPGILVVPLIEESLAEPPTANTSGFDGTVQVLPLAEGDYFIVLWDPTGTYPPRLVNDGGVPLEISISDLTDLGDIDMSTGELIPDLSPHPAALAVGAAHACVLDEDGSVGCWGLSSQGQARPPAGTFTSIAAGYAHTCGLLDDGAIDCWGNNGSGQSVDPVGTFAEVATGDYHTCALDLAGSVSCWGDDTYGQLDEPPGTFTSIAAGSNHTCALTSLGAATCWGSGDYGQAADPTGPFVQLTAGLHHSCGLTSAGTATCWGLTSGRTMTTPGSGYAALSAGRQHTCALTTSGSIVCGGANTAGESNAPTGTFTAMDAGYASSCAVASDESIECWGWNEYGVSTVPTGSFIGIEAGGWVCPIATGGQATCPRRTNSPEPTIPVGAYEQLSGVSAFCGRIADGTLACWGNDSDGQATPPPGTFTDVDMGSLHGCGVKSDGSVECWGRNLYGESTEPPGTFTQVAAGLFHSCAITDTGSITCWGFNGNGQLAAPTTGTYTDITAANGHTCALATNGTIDCWGFNAAGQAADPPGTFVDVSAGENHTCAVTTDGEAVCWGSGTEGQTTPFPEEYVDVSAGVVTTCGLLTDGSYRCWGRITVGTWFDS
jgi:alpha-tubulin suppressor-like RCC1 family protein